MTTVGDDDKPVHSEKAMLVYEREARKSGIEAASMFLRDRAAELFAEGKDDEKARLIRGLSVEVAKLP